MLQVILSHTDLKPIAIIEIQINEPINLLAVEELFISFSIGKPPIPTNDIIATHADALKWYKKRLTLSDEAFLSFLQTVYPDIIIHRTPITHTIKEDLMKTVSIIRFPDFPIRLPENYRTTSGLTT